MGAKSAAEQSSQEVLAILKKGSYVVIFAVPDPTALSTGFPLIPFIPQTVYSIAITEAPGRPENKVLPPSATCGFRTSLIGGTEKVADQHFTLNVCPNNYEGGVGRIPPPTVLLPFISQRFVVRDGHFVFRDPEHSGFYAAVSSGRFFPAPDNAVRIGITVEIAQYLGRMQGLHGNLVVNGWTQPPQTFKNNFILRLVDPAGKLSTDAPIFPPSGPSAEASGGEGVAYIPLLAEPEPGTRISVTPTKDGKKKRIHMLQRLRLVDTAFDIHPVFRSRTVEREVVGEQNTTLIFDPDDPNDVIPLYSVNSELRFFTRDHQSLGSVRANLFEGRAFRTTIPELAQPFFRITGFGPFIEGTKQFGGAVGMVSVNGVLSLNPGAFSGMYMLRVIDPLGRFHAATANVFNSTSSG